MGGVSLEMSIPLDEDNFIEMECDYCKNRFMLHRDVYENEEHINFFCAICGLPNRINTFFVSEVLELAQQKALNYMYDEINRTLGKSIQKINHSGFVKMTISKPKKEVGKELYTPSENYVKCKKICCNIDVKIRNIDKETGTYCPICGGMTND